MRKAQLVDAHLSHHSHQALDLLVREDFGPGQKAGPLRHAVEAANVADGDTDPQIRVHAAERVDEWFYDAHVVHAIVTLVGPSTCPSGWPR